jgi:hypothetical protein
LSLPDEVIVIGAARLAAAASLVVGGRVLVTTIEFF